jgi:phosphorylcholine metabolism protein LicD
MTNDLKHFNKSLGFSKRKIIPDDKMTYFDSSLGFDKFKQTAVDLLKITTDILDEFNIDYFLICGTLLGYVRHNDFIPYDDDMDLIVSSDIKKHLPHIFKKYNYKLSMISVGNLIKLCFNDKVYNLNHFKTWTKFLMNSNDSYFWPFIDLFIYEKKEDTIDFFEKKWDINEFFPIQKKEFNNLLVSIPRNPDYFLRKNYGENYMTILKSSNWNHKKECPIYQRYSIKMEEFNEYKEEKEIKK